MTTIKNNLTTGIDLNSGSFTSPVQIDAGVSISNTGSDAIYGSTVSFTIQNYGAVSGSGSGIYLAPGGSVTNAASASITGGTFTGVFIDSGTGIVSNAGLISSVDDKGVLLNSGGTVDNLAGGTISGADRSIYIQGGAGTVTNAGLMTGGGNGAVSLEDGGRITNTGTMTGGAAILGAVGDVTNSRGIDGAQAGVVIEDGGTITNQAGATIGGTYVGAVMGLPGQPGGGGGALTNQTGGTISGDSGVFATGGSSTVVNAGTITGTLAGTFTVNGIGLVTGTGVSISGGGSVANQSGGSIAGVNSGIYVGTAVGLVVNAGDIAGTGTAGRGVFLAAGGAVTNGGTGTTIGGSGNGVHVGGAGGTNSNGGTATITGAGGNGVYVTGGVGTVFNAGVITATGGTHSAIGFLLGGYVSNAGAGTISGALSGGIYVTGAAGTVVNAGQITGGGTKHAASMEDGGSVTNQAGGVMTGGTTQAAIFITGATGGVVNFGTLFGANLSAGGTVTNHAGGTISNSGGGGVNISGTIGRVINAGSISTSHTNSAAVGLDAGGYVGNQTGGTINSVIEVGVFITGGFGNVMNNGLILGHGTGGTYYPGVDLVSGGAVTNAATASITGGNNGIFVFKGRGIVFNSGSIAGTAAHANGIAFYTDGVISNAASAAISGTRNGVYFEGRYDGTTSGIGDLSNAASAVITGGVNGIYGVLNNNAVVANDGSITGVTGDGIQFAGGFVTNGASGVITGAEVGVDILIGGGTVTNAGTIIGNSGTAVAFGGTFSNRVVLSAGYGFSGDVIGSASATNTLELASAASAGAVTGLGTKFLNFGAIAFDPGAQWLLSGSTAALAGGQTLSGFAPGDTIDLVGVSETIASFTGGALSLTGSVPLDLLLPGSYTTPQFHAGPSSDGTVITVACFRFGTRILGARGEIPVEQLRLGERVLADAGEGRTALRPILWIGHRTVDCRRHPNPGLAWPVRVAAGAFGPSRPHSDLFLSPDHAVSVGGALIPIKLLINGTSIAQVPLDEVTYYHVELPQHAVIFAEGLPCESFLETGNRSNFTNGGETVALHPDFASLLREAEACAPLIVTGPNLDAVRRLVNARVVDALAQRGNPDVVSSGLLAAVIACGKK